MLFGTYTDLKYREEVREIIGDIGFEGKEVVKSILRV